MSKARSTGNISNVIKTSTTCVTVTDGTTDLLIMSGSGRVTIPGDLVVLGGIAGSSAESASYSLSSSFATNANLLDGIDGASFLQTGSFNAFSSSIDTTIKNKLNNDGVISGSVQVDITSTTGYSTFSSSLSSSIGSLSGSVATTTSGLAGRITTVEGNYATTGSNTFIGDQTITGSICSNGNIVTTGQIVAQTINVQQVTSSIVYSCGSNTFGCSLTNNQVFTGSVFITGSNIIACVDTSCFGGSIAISEGNDLIFRDTSNYISSPATDTLRIVTTNSERIRITSTGISCFACQVCAPAAMISGCVGIGTASPGERLDVNGNINFSGRLTTGGLGARLWVPGQSIGQASNAGLYAMGLTYLAKYDTQWLSVGGGHASALTIDEGIFSFSNSQGVGAADSALTWTTRLMINTSGNVGIGTVCPSNKLDVNGTLSTSLIIPYGTTYKTSNFLDFYPGNDNVLFFHAGTSWGDPLIAVNGTTAGSVLTNSLAQQLVIRGDGTNGIGFSNGSCINMIIKGGCVGIGTTSPSTSLHISNNSNAGLRIQATASNGSSELDLLSHGTQNSFIDFGPNRLIFRSTNCDMTDINDGNVLVLNNNGCVGINTSTPRSVLHVQQASNDGVPSVGCARDGLIISSNNGNYGLNIGVDPTGPTWMQAMRFDDGATAYNLLFQPTGGCSVLIGTGTALAGCRQQLVIGGNSFGSLIALGNNGNGNKFVIESDSGENVLINNKSNTPMIFYTNNSRRFDITSDGIACFACQVCAKSLTIATDCSGVVVDVANRHGFMKYVNYSTGLVGACSGTDSNIATWLGRFAGTIFSPTAVYQDLVINGSGNVGIGISSPSYKLEVCGPGETINIIGASSGDIATGFRIGRGASLGAQIYDNPQDNITTINAAGGLNLRTGGSGRLSILSTGIACFACRVCAPTLVAGGRTVVYGGGIYDDTINGNNIGIGFAATGIVPIDGAGNAANGTKDLGSSSARWCTVYTSDLSLNNGIGNYTIVEGENDLFIYNNNSCKVYKFLLQEVCPEMAPAKRSI
jgi:hypothetical protein